jgi:hypothetical protein
MTHRGRGCSGGVPLFVGLFSGEFTIELCREIVKQIVPPHGVRA